MFVCVEFCGISLPDAVPAMVENHDMPETIEKALLTLKRRYAVCFILATTCRCIIVWNFAAGTAFLIMRQIGLLADHLLPVGFIGLPVSLAAALLITRRRMSQQTGWLALIDNYNSSGGLLLAVAETSDTGWHEKLPATPKLPELRLQMSQHVATLLVSIFFMALCLMLPVVSLSGQERSRIAQKDLALSVEQQTDLLETEKILSPEAAAEIRQSLQQISSESDSFSPAVTFEALDQLREKLKVQAVAGSQQKIAAARDLAELDKIAQQMAATTGKGENSAALSAMAQRLLKGLSEGRTTGNTDIPDNVKRSLDAAEKDLENGAETAQQAAAELQKYLKEQREKIAALAEKLAKARMIDQKTFNELQKAGRIKPATETDLQPGSDTEIILAPAQDASNGTPGSDASIQTAGSSPSGKPGREGGAAALNFNRLTSGHGVKFIDQNLPSAEGQNLEQSVTIGVSHSVPRIESAGHGNGSAAATDWQKPSENVLESGIILPGHRNAVKKYFDPQNP